MPYSKDKSEIERTDFHLFQKQYAVVHTGLAIDTFWYNNIQQDSVQISSVPA